MWAINLMLASVSDINLAMGLQKEEMSAAVRFPREHGPGRRTLPAGIKPTDVPLESLRDFVPDGSVVVLGGTAAAARPMAVTRELIRGDVSGLHLITGGGGLETDLLLAAGAVSRLTFAYMSLGPFGIAPAFRAAINGGGLDYDLVSGQFIGIGLDAAARGVPFLPAAAIDTEAPYLDAVPELWSNVDTPFSDGPAMVIGAMTPDVAIVHAEAIDDYGNAMLPLTVALDSLLSKAAKRTIVTYERRVPGRLSASGRFLARCFIDVTAEAPRGALPTSFAPHYGFDVSWFESYLAGPAAPEAEIETIREAGEAEYALKAFSGDSRA
jgi:glutaconate CoA-transferase subunit A